MPEQTLLERAEAASKLAEENEILARKNEAMDALHEILKVPHSIDVLHDIAGSLASITARTICASASFLNR